MRRILGKVSYFKGHTADTYASQKTFEVYSELSGYALRVYKDVEMMEEEREQRQRTQGREGRTNIFQMSGAVENKSSLGETFRSYSRQACNFVIPDINQKINGMKRPRPSEFGASDVVLKTQDASAKTIAKNKYENAIRETIEATREYWKGLALKDKKSGHTLEKHLEEFRILYEKNPDDPIEALKYLKITSQSELFNSVRNCSEKITRILFLAYVSPGSIMIYTSFVRMEGIDALKLYLDCFNFSHFKVGKSGGKDYNRYADFQLSSEKRNEEVRSAFNNVSNKDGKDIKVILLSSKSTEGITLLNVRQVHILESYWQETTIAQAIGRAIRYCSHMALPLEERKVEIFRYFVTQPNLKATADQLLFDLAKRKAGLVSGFQQCLKEAAVDCQLYRLQNCDDTPEEKCHCFQFDLASNFTNISQAYTKELRNDLSGGKGSYAEEIKKHRVFEITGQITYNVNKTLPKAQYWYDPKTNVVYDHQLMFPVGKASLGKDSIPIRLDDVFLIKDYIQIPLI